MMMSLQQNPPILVDFDFVYQWIAASIPPPYHYEYQIRVTAEGRGEIEFLPGYAQHAPPRWVENFDCTPLEIQQLYQMAVSANLARKTWRKPMRRVVGGEQQWCHFTRDDQTYQVPIELTRRDMARVQPVYEYIKSLVPHRIWDSLQRQFEHYQHHLDP